MNRASVHSRYTEHNGGSGCGVDFVGFERLGGQNRMILALVWVGDNLGIVTLAFRRQAIVDRKPNADAIVLYMCV